MLNNCLSGFETNVKLVPELMPHQNILNRHSSFLLLDLSSVSLVGDDGSLEDLLEVISMFLLLSQVVQFIAALDALHRL